MSKKVIKYGGKWYELKPETNKHTCKDCDLYERSCPPKVTKECTKGFILKRFDLKTNGR